MAAGRPQFMSLLRLLQVFDVQRPHVLAAHVVPEGHAQVGIGRGDGEADQPGHLLLLVFAISGFPRRVGVSQHHVDEAPRTACRGQQEATSQPELESINETIFAFLVGKKASLGVLL